MGITLNNASNNDEFIRLLANWSIDNSFNFNSNFHFCYFAHVINLAVQVALSCLNKEISKVKFVI